MAKEDKGGKPSNKKTTIEWFEYYANKAREEGWVVTATLSRLVTDDEKRLGESEGKTL